MYDVTNKSSDWWSARLARDVRGEGGVVGKQGWVPSSFLDKFSSSLSPDEEAAYWLGMYVWSWIVYCCLLARYICMVLDSLLLLTG